MVELIRHSCVNLVTLNDAFEFKHAKIDGQDALHAYAKLNGRCYGPAECVFAAGLAHSNFMHNHLEKALSLVTEAHSERAPKPIYQEYVQPLDSIERYLESVCSSRSIVDARACDVVQGVLQSAVLLSDFHSTEAAKNFAVKCLSLGFYETSSNCFVKTGLGFNEADMVKISRRLIGRIFNVEAESSLVGLVDPVLSLWSQINSELNIMNMPYDPRMPGMLIGDFLSSMKSSEIAAALLKSSQSQLIQDINFDLSTQMPNSNSSDEPFDFY